MTTRPLWKRVASRVRRAIYRLATPLDRLVHRDADGLLPPAHLRIYYYGTWDPRAFARACEIKNELVHRGLRPEHRVLDIGSGIGNLAIGLIGYLHGTYDGLDIHPEAVAWCQRAITPRHPVFRFHRADVASRAYNPRGAVPASQYRFPFADASFDVIFLASVFTHMLPDEVDQYLREIARLLAPDGICIASFFLLNEKTRDSVTAGRSFMSFDVPHSSGVCRLHDAAVPEAAVAFEESFVEASLARAGLRLRGIRRGNWWSGAVHDQDVLTLTRIEELKN